MYPKCPGHGASGSGSRKAPKARTASNAIANGLRTERLQALDAVVGPRLRRRPSRLGERRGSSSA